MNKIEPTIGILKETISNWERRVALTPYNCFELIKLEVKVIVQPSKTRCFTDSEYSSVGAILKEDLSECQIILGISEPEINNLIEDKTYLFFSYLQKGKPKNLKILNAILSKRIRLIDYECIKEVNYDSKIVSKRLVSFGKIAGIAGAINILKGVGELLLSRNYATPFIFTKLSYMYIDIEEAKNNFKILGNYLREKYLPIEFTPFIIGVLGNGQVSSGVQEAFNYLPAEKITPEQLLSNDYEKGQDKIYIVVFKLEHIYSKTNSDENFNKDDFLKSPEQYSSIFFRKYFKYCNILINCLYWEYRYPKVIRKADLQHIFSSHKQKLLGICDISCDIGGSIEILKEYLSHRSPFVIYEPVTEEYIENIDYASKEGIIFSAIPHLAASFPLDASEYFSNLLQPFIINLANSNYPSSLNESGLCEELKNACITNQGTLTYLYRNIFTYAEETKNIYLTSCENVNKEVKYFTTIKTTGHLFDSGFFNELIKYLNTNNLKHRVNFLNVGESAAYSSVLYFDAYAENKNDIEQLLTFMDSKSKANDLSFSILKQNFK